MQLVGSPTYLSDGNLSANSIVGVCDKIARRMASDLPHQCKPFYNETKYSPSGYALTTDYNSTGLFFRSPGDPCMIKASNESNQVFNGVLFSEWAEANATSHLQYDSNHTAVFPLLTVLMPVANSQRQLSIYEASSVATCLRVTDYNPGSRIPPSNGEPIPVQTSTGGGTLSNGETIGVAVAVVVGFGLLAIALVMWWLRRRKASRAVAQALLSDSSTHGKDSLAVETLEFGGDGARHELDPANQRVTELPDVGGNGPVELGASNSVNRHSGRLPL